MSVTVRDLMTANPAVVSRDSTIQDGLRTLLREAISEIYVTDADGRLQGVVSDYELLKAQLAQVPVDEPIAGLMSCSPKTFAPDDEIATVAGVYREGRYHRVAVVDDGRLVGQLSRYDVLRFMATCEPIGQGETTRQPASGNLPPVGKPRFLHERSTPPAKESALR